MSGVRGRSGRHRNPPSPGKVRKLLAAREQGYSVRDAALLAGVPYSTAYTLLQFDVHDPGPEPYYHTRRLTMGEKERIERDKRREEVREWARKNPEKAMSRWSPEELEALFADDEETRT